MEFYDVVNARRSIRRYKAAPVERERIDRILDAAHKAPSWNNRQCWRFVLVSDPDLKAMLGRQIGNPSAECYENAPYALALCADPTDSGVAGGKEYYLADCGAAMEHVQLAAAAEGLGTCFVGSFSEYTVRTLLNIPKDVRVVALSPIGWPDEAPEARPRASLGSLVFENGWRREHAPFEE
ncbi:MAG: nitroreductase family protein [Clostridiaceae bacterium]|nr:nitroreductase family protein [Eubacteriales bacterium]